MSQAATTLTSTWLSDEAILGMEPDSSAATSPASRAISGPDGFADAADAGLLRDTSSSPAREPASVAHSETNRATDPNANPDAVNANANEASPAAPPPEGAKRDTSVTIHALPAATLEQLDAAYYSPEPQARAQFAQSLFANDPAAFRNMFNEAAKLLGLSVPNADPLPVGQAFLPVPPAHPATAANAPAQTAQPQPGPSADQNSVIPSEARNLSASAAEQSPVFPAAQYRAFESATNAALSQEVRTAITATLDHALPEGTAPGAARRIADDIFTDIGQHLASDAQLSSQVGEVLRGWQFGPQEQQQVNALLTARAKQLLPSAARRVIGEWSSSVLTTARARAARSEASASRVDVGNAAARPAGNTEPARAPRPKEIDYARTTDDDIFAM